MSRLNRNNAPTGGAEAPGSRRRTAGRKGDSRELAILDVAERLLDGGFDAMTVEAVARGAGISRASLYFYFGSKDDVLIALVARTMKDITERYAQATWSGTDPRSILDQGLTATEQMWREHGRVMRAAVEVGPSIPVVLALWRDTLEDSAQRFRVVLEGCGVPDGDGPAEALGMSRALCMMAERSYYWSYVATADERLHEVTAACGRLLGAALNGLRHEGIDSPRAPGC
jgi:TetR/AcrR family transcriptional regulator, ethionamide resistance regulator